MRPGPVARLGGASDSDPARKAEREGCREGRKRQAKRSVCKRGDVWWIEFTIAGKRVRESAKTTRRTIADECQRRRKREFERAFAGCFRGTLRAPQKCY